MSKQRLMQVLSGVGRLAAAGAFVGLISTPLAARQTGDPRDPAGQDSLNRRDMRERESALRIKAKTQRKPLLENPTLALGQINEDYQRIQVLNNELRRAAAAPGGALDYKRVSNASAEVKKRAARLKENLAFPEPDEDPKAEKKQPPAPDDGQVRASLSALDNLIVSFVTNPLFQSDVLKVDARLAVKASRDLNQIIELCGGLKKSAERLGKNK